VVGRIVVSMVSHLSRPSWKLLFATLLALSLTIGPLASAGAFGPGDTADALVPGQILVQFKPGTAAWDRAGLHASLGVKSKGTIPQIDVEIVGVPAGRSAEGLIKMYEKNPNVVFAEPDYILTATAVVPNDPYYSNQKSYMDSIAAPQGWAISTGSADVTIAVLDTGVSPHSDLAGRLVKGRDIINSDDDPADDHGHGTLVAGVAAATGNNAIGVAGVNWAAKIMPVKVLSSSGAGTTSQVAQGLIWAADNGADVANMSLGGTTSANTLQNACDYALGKGVVLVAAAGNDGTSKLNYPAAYESVIAVAGLNFNCDALASWSSRGEGLDLSAPGTRIWGTTYDGSYGYASGTSVASPFVAGYAALVLSVNPTLTPTDVRGVLTSTATDLGAAGWDPTYGWGRIHLERGLLSAGGIQAPAPEPEPAPAPEPEPEPAPAPEPEPEPAPAPEPEPEPAPAPEPDSTAPTVSILSPADGAVLSGNARIDAAATDDVAVARVDFYANGALIGSSSSAPYSLRWNTRQHSDGQYTIKVVALDTSGNSGYATIGVTLSNSKSGGGGPSKTGGSKK
jgi:thermitase